MLMSWYIYFQRIPFILFSIFLLIPGIQAQLLDIDSLERHLSSYKKEDSFRTNTLTELATMNVYRNPDKAILYVKEAIDLSRKIDDKKRLAKSLQVLGSIKMIEGDYAKAIDNFNQSVQVARSGSKEWSDFQIASVNGDLGTVAFLNNDYTEAISKYLNGLAYLEKQSGNNIQYTKHGLYTQLHELYDQLDDSVNAENYLNKAFQLAGQLKDTGLLLWDGFDRISMLIDRKNCDEAIRQLSALKRLIGEYSEDFMMAKYYFYRALCYGENKRYDSAIAAMRKSQELYREYHDMNGEYSSRDQLAKLCIITGRYKEADSIIAVNFKISESNRDWKSLSESYHLQAEMAITKNEFEKALRLNELAAEMEDSMRISEHQRQVVYAGAKFQVVRQQDEIVFLQSENHKNEIILIRRQWWLLILVVLLSVATIIGVLLFRNYRQKQKLQQQRIAELETEKKLMAAEAVLKGEEQERTRLAKDLHDGLGGMLSGIKYVFQNMKGNLIMTPESQQSFERGMDMLDTSIKEMRRVAHNMMPEALVKFGLDIALKDFCNDINQSGVLKLTYQSIGMEKVSLEHTVSITIYRIVQELINNTIKHSAAKTAIVQLTNNEGHFLVTVEDDGKGFDTSILKGSKGMGWSNIESRVGFLKGTIDLQSSPGKGTSVHLEIPVE